MIPAQHIAVWEAESILIREQVRLGSGSLATASDVSAITIRVFDVGATREETVAVYSTTLVVADTIAAASTAGWTRDNIGYNLETTLDAEAFTRYGGHTYVVEILLATVADGPIAVVAYVAVLGLHSGQGGSTALDELIAVEMREKLNTVQRGATVCDQNAYRLWSVHPSDELTRPPFVFADTFVEVAQAPLLTPLFRDAGFLWIRAVVKYVKATSGSTNFIPVFELQAAPDYTGFPWISSSDRGKIPTALGTWDTKATLTCVRVDVAASSTGYLVLDWFFDQIASGVQLYSAKTHCTDAGGSLTTETTPHSYINTASLDVTSDILMRLRVKTSAAPASGLTCTLMSTDAVLLNRRVTGPIL